MASVVMCQDLLPLYFRKVIQGEEAAVLDDVGIGVWEGQSQFECVRKVCVYFSGWHLNFKDWHLMLAGCSVEMLIFFLSVLIDKTVNVTGRIWTCNAGCLVIDENNAGSLVMGKILWDSNVEIGSTRLASMSGVNGSRKCGAWKCIGSIWKVCMGSGLGRVRQG